MHPLSQFLLAFALSKAGHARWNEALKRRELDARNLRRCEARKARLQPFRDGSLPPERTDQC